MTPMRETRQSERSADRHSDLLPTGERLSVAESNRPRTRHAIYLGTRTVVIGPGGPTLHRHTRGTLDRSAAVIGYGRLGARRKLVARLLSRFPLLEDGEQQGVDDHHA
jgi:hypothetical protein